MRRALRQEGNVYRPGEPMDHALRQEGNAYRPRDADAHGLRRRSKRGFASRDAPRSLSATSLAGCKTGLNGGLRLNISNSRVEKGDLPPLLDSPKNEAPLIHHYLLGSGGEPPFQT